VSLRAQLLARLCQDRQEKPRKKELLLKEALQLKKRREQKEPANVHKRQKKLHEQEGFTPPKQNFIFLSIC
jgi:hypothetical protein